MPRQILEIVVKKISQNLVLRQKCCIWEMRSAFRNHSEHTEYKNCKIGTGSEVNRIIIRLYDRWELFSPASLSLKVYLFQPCTWMQPTFFESTCILPGKTISGKNDLWVLQLVCGIDVCQFRALCSVLTKTLKSSSAPLGHRRAYWDCQPFFLLATLFIRLINSWIVEKQLLWGGFS